MFLGIEGVTVVFVQRAISIKVIRRTVLVGLAIAVVVLSIPADLLIEFEFFCGANRLEVLTYDSATCAHPCATTFSNCLLRAIVVRVEKAFVCLAIAVVVKTITKFLRRDIG
jgi:hypothetical protein